jgi:mevalonate kinase
LPSENPNLQSAIYNLQSRIGAGSAPGKVILCGEHAVVYGQPAIAVPVSGVQASVTVRANLDARYSSAGLQVVSHNLDGFDPAERQRIQQRLWAVAERVKELIEGVSQGVINHAPTEDPDVGAQFIAPCLPNDLLITIDSTIPIERGLGSGAAIGVAMIRAFADYLGLNLTDDEVSAMAYETEKLHHGTPSGIDNTVVAYNQPVYFERGQTIEVLHVGASLHLLVADSGPRGSTADIVGGVRQRHNANPVGYDTVFKQIGDISRQARTAVEQGDVRWLGELFDRNQQLLEAIEVSSPALKRLCAAARNAGALGAKLSGAGRGGNMIALVMPEAKAAVRDTLLAAGVVAVIETTVEPTTSSQGVK